MQCIKALTEFHFLGTTSHCHWEKLKGIGSYSPILDPSKRQMMPSISLQNVPTASTRAQSRWRLRLRLGPKRLKAGQWLGSVVSLASGPCGNGFHWMKNLRKRIKLSPPNDSIIPIVPAHGWLWSPTTCAAATCHGIPSKWAIPCCAGLMRNGVMPEDLGRSTALFEGPA